MLKQVQYENNVFVERVLPGSILRKLSAHEMEAYRRPFTTPGESRRPTLTWPEPGAILTGPQREFCRTWPNQIEVTVRGSHFIQEDSPQEIGQALRHWLSGMQEAALSLA